MTDREKFPAKSLTRDVAVPAEQHGSLVARGLAAVREIGKQQLSLTAEVDADGLFELGMRYRYGEGGTQVDEDQARKYFLAASERDHAEAQFELALLVGENGEQDEADRWLKRSANLGFGPALYALADDSDLSEDEYDDLIVRTRAWYLTRATAGDAKRQYEYARMLRQARLHRGESDEALRWLKASAEQNYPQACSDLARLYIFAWRGH
jgi:TPR repeat protein